MASVPPDLAASALAYHRVPRPGKLEIQATKPLGTQHDLSLAYSPGVAAACLEIAADPSAAASLTIRQNHLLEQSPTNPNQVGIARNGSSTCASIRPRQGVLSSSSRQLPDA
jgi:malic enzyme